MSMTKQEILRKARELVDTEVVSWREAKLCIRQLLMVISNDRWQEQTAAVLRVEKEKQE